MTIFNSLAALLVPEATTTATSLAHDLRAIADTLEASSPVAPTGGVGPDLVMDDSLEALKRLRDSLDRHGDDLMAIAALGRNTMSRIADKTGMSESAIPIRLARTERLGKFATKTGNGQLRVGSRGLGAATWALRAEAWLDEPEEDLD